MLGEVVTNIGSSRAPVNEEMDTTGVILNPIIAHVNGFGYFCLMASLSKPAEVELSKRHGLGSWAFLSLERVIRMGMDSWPLRKLSPILASAAEAMTLERILERVKMGPLMSDSP